MLMDTLGYFSITVLGVFVGAGCSRFSSGVAALTAMFGVVFTQAAFHWGLAVVLHLRFGIGRRRAEEKECAAEQQA